MPIPNRKLFIALVPAFLAFAAQPAFAQDQFSGGSRGEQPTMSGPTYDSYVDLSNRADKMFARGKMLQAAELYAEAVRAAKKAKITDVPRWYKFLKAAKESGNAELLKEARANVAEMRAESNSLFSDPCRGIKCVCLVLKNTRGSKWDSASPVVRQRLEAEVRKQGLIPVSQKDAGADAMMVEIESDTRRAGNEQYSFNAYRADRTHYLASGYSSLMKPVKSTDDLATELAGAIDSLAESIHQANIE